MRFDFTVDIFWQGTLFLGGVWRGTRWDKIVRRYTHPRRASLPYTAATKIKLGQGSMSRPLVCARLIESAVETVCPHLLRWKAGQGLPIFENLHTNPGRNCETFACFEYLLLFVDSKLLVSSNFPQHSLCGRHPNPQDQQALRLFLREPPPIVFETLHRLPMTTRPGHNHPHFFRSDTFFPPHLDSYT